MAVAGIAGGVFAASASHPFDTIKTRMQAHMYSKPEYMTWMSTASTIYKEGGVLNFWRGLLPRMTRIIGEYVGMSRSVGGWDYAGGLCRSQASLSCGPCRVELAAEHASSLAAIGAHNHTLGSAD